MDFRFKFVEAIFAFLSVGLWHTIVGVALGIPAALKIQNLIKRKSDKLARTELIRLLKDSLIHNQHLLTQLENDFNSESRGRKYCPLYSLNLSLLDATAYRKYELGLSSKICEKIDKVRYELHHLDGKLLLMRNAWSRGNTQQSSDIMKSCKEQLSIVHLAIEEANEIL